MNLRPADDADEPFPTELVQLAAGWRGDAPAPMTPARGAPVWETALLNRLIAAAGAQGHPASASASSRTTRLSASTATSAS